jgi:hypothetical protein
MQLNELSILLNRISNYWNICGISHKGWSLIDVKEDVQDEDDTDYEPCMRYGNENKRIEFLFEFVINRRLRLFVKG